jgi:hypothetical protein
MFTFSQVSGNFFLLYKPVAIFYFSHVTAHFLLVHKPLALFCFWWKFSPVFTFWHNCRSILCVLGNRWSGFTFWNNLLPLFHFLRCFAVFRSLKWFLPVHSVFSEMSKKHNDQFHRPPETFDNAGWCSIRVGCYRENSWFR